jgi:hypothetical protein
MKGIIMSGESYGPRPQGAGMREGGHAEIAREEIELPPVLAQVKATTEEQVLAGSYDGQTIYHSRTEDHTVEELGVYQGTTEEVINLEFNRFMRDTDNRALDDLLPDKYKLANTPAPRGKVHPDQQEVGLPSSTYDRWDKERDEQVGRLLRDPEKAKLVREAQEEARAELSARADEIKSEIRKKVAESTAKEEMKKRIGKIAIDEDHLDEKKLQQSMAYKKTSRDTEIDTIAREAGFHYFLTYEGAQYNSGDRNSLKALNEKYGLL